MRQRETQRKPSISSSPDCVQNNLLNASSELDFSLNFYVVMHFLPGQWLAFAACSHLKIELCDLSPPVFLFPLSWFSGLRKGNEIMTLNGEAVSDLDIRQMEALFSEKSVGLRLIARPVDTRTTLCTSWSDSDLSSRDRRGLPPSPNQSQLLEEFLNNFKKTSANGKAVFHLELLVP